MLSTCGLPRLLLVLGVIFVVSSCSNSPDWQALYTAKLGQPVTELNEAALNTDFRDNEGTLTRITWAKLADGQFVLLGLPAYSNSPQVVADRTTVLSQSEFERKCREAFEQHIDGFEWGSPEEAFGNTFIVKPMFVMPAGEGTISAPAPKRGYCQFVFRPQGWELRVVQSHGIIKSDVPGAQVP